MRGLVVAIALFGAALPAAAGAVRPSQPREIQRTSRVTYYATKGKPVDVARTEAFLDRLETLFGAPPPGWRVSYHLHDAPSIVHADSSRAAVGVTDLETLRIDTVRAYHPHELVHAAAGRLGRPPLLFAEGLAVALTSAGSWHGTDIDRAAEAALHESRSLSPFLDRFMELDADTAYAVAGSFVGYLLDRHGIEPFVDFLRGCGPDGERYEAAFRRSYGLTVARASIEWQRALRAPTTAPRGWYDSSSWPQSLHAHPEPAARAAHAAARAGEPGADGPATGSPARVLDPLPAGGPAGP